jgi:P27 family predicted phage terminase small subunit
VSTTKVECPGYFSDAQREAWNRIVGDLLAVKISIVGKWEVLERYAVTYCLWSDCQRAIAEKGQTIYSRRNPRMVDFHKFNSDLASIRSELGLGPASDAKRTKKERKSEQQSSSSSEQSRQFRLLSSG